MSSPASSPIRYHSPGADAARRNGRLAAWGLLGALVLVPASGHGQITQIIDSSGDGTSDLRGATALATDSAGNVFVTGAQGDDNVFKIAPGGVITEIIDSSGDGASGLDSPRGVATDPSGNVFVTGFASDNAFKITPTGVIVEIIDASGDGSNGLERPRGIATDSSGNVFVAGEGTDNVFKVTPGGVITEILDASGDGSSELDFPFDVATDSFDNVFVVALRSSNAFRITPGGVITEIIDATGDGTSALAAGASVATDFSGNVFVTGDRNAFKITPGGVITEIIDTSGDGTNGLVFAQAVATDPAGNVLVVGGFSRNAFEITPGGEITQIIDASGDGTRGLDNPTGIATDSAGNVFVAGNGSNNVFKIASVPPVVSQTVRGKSFLVQDPSAGADPGQRRVGVRAKERASPNRIVGDPTVGGATVEVVANGSRPTRQTFSLPAAFWRASAGVPGTRFQYRDPQGESSPVTRAHIRQSSDGLFTLRLQIDGSKAAAESLEIVPPDDGTDAFVVLEILGGNRYCVAFGPDGKVRNQGSRWFRVTNPTEEGCPP